ncbi:MAG: outer membrane protein assembly factor BamE, partial [Pseudomonadota bacterium]|nr:outer membrane protein assembly factor BamE [Pseudomonadota bacterium]
AGVMRNDAWYYVSSRVETLAYNAPEVTDRRIVAVHFDDAGVLASADVYGLEDGRIINLVTRTTPTFGRELTILQQIFGNLTNAGAAVAAGAAED